MHVYGHSVLDFRRGSKFSVSGKSFTRSAHGLFYRAFVVARSFPHIVIRRAKNTKTIRVGDSY